MNFDDDVMELKFDICVFVIEIMNECLANGLSYITNEMEKYSSDSSFLDSDSKSSSLYEVQHMFYLLRYTLTVILSIVASKICVNGFR